MEELILANCEQHCDEIQVFTSELFGNIRIIMDDGKPLFCGSDVAKALGYSNASDAITRHCRYIVKRDTPTAQGNVSSMSYIPESDLYRLSAHSKLPSAEKFESWVFDDVLPTIRKHGGYLTPDTIEKVLSDPDTIIRLATDLKAEKQKRLQAEKQRDILLHVQKTYTSTEIAKEIGMKSAQALNLWLAEKGIQFKQNGTWVLYSKYADLGYTEIKQNVLDNGKIVYDRRWTNYGRDFILKLWEEEKHGISDDN